MNELNINGLLLETKETDYVMSDYYYPLIPKNTNTKKYYYNQAAQKETYWSCGIYGSLGCLSDLFGYKFTNEELLECVMLAKEKYNLVDGEGMTMANAIDCARNYWNTKFPNKKVKSYRTTIGSAVFFELINNGHSLAVGYRSSTDYYNDSQDDGIVQGEDFIKQGGHLVRVNREGDIKIDDNYFGRKKYNTYVNNNIEILNRNGVFFSSAYFFLKEETIEDVIMQELEFVNAKLVYKLGLTSGLEPSKGITRKECFAVIGALIRKLVDGEISKEKVEGVIDNLNIR